METGISSIGKLGADLTEYGEWLARLLTIYLRDPAPPRVASLMICCGLFSAAEHRRKG